MNWRETETETEGGTEGAGFVTVAWDCEGAVLGGVRRQARGCDVAVERGPAGGQLSFRDARGGVPRTRRPEQPMC